MPTGRRKDEGYRYFGRSRKDAILLLFVFSLFRGEVEKTKFCFFLSFRYFAAKWRRRNFASFRYFASKSKRRNFVPFCYFDFVPK